MAEKIKFSQFPEVKEINSDSIFPAVQDGENVKITYENLAKGLGISDEKIGQAVETYLAENPVQTGATQEQAEQIEKNTEDISKITESLTEKEASGTADSKVSEHNTSETSHSDIRLLIEGLTTRLNALADSDDTTLDQMSEVVAYIKSNKTLIEAITTNKVSVSDIVDNLTTSASNKPLSAKQGVALKALIDAIVVPKKTSQLTNDSGFLTEHQDISGLAPKATTLSGYGITDGATKEQFNQLSEENAELKGDLVKLEEFSESTSDTLMDAFGSVVQRVAMNVVSTDRGYPQFDENGVFTGWGTSSSIYHTVTDVNVGDKITVLSKGKTTYSRLCPYMLYILDANMKILEKHIPNTNDDIYSFEGYVKSKFASKIIVLSSTSLATGYALTIKSADIDAIKRLKPTIIVSNKCDADTNGVYGTSETRSQGDVCADGKYIYTCAQRYIYKIDVSCPLAPEKVESANLTQIFSGYPNNSYGKCSGIKVYGDKVIATFRTPLSSESSELTAEQTVGTIAMFNKSDLSLVSHIPMKEFMLGGSLTIVEDLVIVGLIKRGFRVYKIGADGFTLLYDGSIPVSSIVNAIEWQYSSVDTVNKYIAFARYKSGIIVYKYTYNGTTFTADVFEEFDIRNYTDITSDNGIHTVFDVAIKDGYLYAPLALARSQIGTDAMDNRGILWGKIGSLATTYKIAKISDDAKSTAITGGDPAPIHIDIKDDVAIINLDFKGIGFYKIENNVPTFVKNDMKPMTGRYSVYCHFENGDRIITTGYFDGAENCNIQISETAHVI